MEMNFGIETTKVQPLYILYVLKKFTDEKNTLSQEGIARKLRDLGYCPVRKDKNGNSKERKIDERKSIGQDLKLLYYIGYPIHGVEKELDEDGNELPATRGKIWIEKEISDEKLSWLINSIKYNAFMDESQKKEFIESLISLGSKTFQHNNDAKTMVDGGRIFYVEGASLFKQLSEIDKAIALGKKIRFTYSKLKRNGSKFVYEAEKEYTVSPYWVIVNKGNTYLVCYNHEENKIWHSRVDKMKDVKMINSYALPKTETELKGVDVGDYVTKHPLMFSGDNISVELKIAKNQIGRLVEAFGTNFSIVKETEDYLTVKVYAGELDVFYWTIQYGSFVEVLKPQSLRDKIRIHIESLAFNYKMKDGDKYSEAIRNAIRTKVLDLSGIDLTGKKEHYDLKRITKVYLSNNNIDNVGFLKEYYSLQELCLENNPVTDLSVLSNLKGLKDLTLANLKLKNIDFVAGKYFSNLVLDLGRKTDFSALAKINCKKVKIGGSSYYNYSIPHTELEKSKIECEYFDVEPEAPKVADIKIFRDNYPFNFLDDAFGSWSIIPEKIEETKKEIENVFGKFNAVEKRYLELYYKERIMNIEDIRKILKISQRECEQLRDTIKSKIVHPSINGELKKYFLEGALEGKFQNTDVIFSYINLTEALEKNKKTK